MAQLTWLITGVSSGFGRELTRQLLERGDRVVGTVRDTGKVADLRELYRETARIYDRRTRSESPYTGCHNDEG
jgi:NAD(P)-dependent dehydrogenase (short-subunit alcohol dehydrogenase family)